MSLSLNKSNSVNGILMNLKFAILKTLTFDLLEAKHTISYLKTLGSASIYAYNMI